jgi:glycosyltransferase involved in cell wall biosynthesis
MGRVVPDCIDHNACGPGLNWDDPLSRCGLYGRTVLLTLGRLACDEQYKGHDEILEVLPELAEEVPGVAYLVCGDGDDRSPLKRKAERLALSDRVVFAGYVPEDEKKEHCRLVDAFVMTGRGEGFGTVYLAAERGVPEGLAYFSEGRFRARWHRVVDEHLRGKVATAAAPTP